jgi:protein TonB
MLRLGNKQTAFAGGTRELVPLPGVQYYEDARTSHPCERGAGLLRFLSNPQEAGVAKISVLARRTFLWRCVMSIEPGPSSNASPQNEFGSLHGCFVEGTPEQRARQRSIRRRALIISIATQAAILTAIILVPLFGKPERVALANVMPIPPYFHTNTPERQNTASQQNTQRRRNPLNLNVFSQPTRIPPSIDEHPDPGSQDPPEIPSGSGPATPCPGCIPIADGRPQPERPADVRPQAPHRLVLTHLESAMLIRRVEPSYPALAKQIHKEGQVELRAIIATDGTIQSLQVVSGDPLFLRSAEDAVTQWRYRPTVLNGQPVEIETYITVIYTLQH